MRVCAGCTRTCAHNKTRALLLLLRTTGGRTSTGVRRSLSEQVTRSYPRLHTLKRNSRRSLLCARTRATLALQRSCQPRHNTMSSASSTAVNGLTSLLDSLTARIAALEAAAGVRPAPAAAMPLAAAGAGAGGAPSGGDDDVPAAVSAFDDLVSKFVEPAAATAAAIAPEVDAMVRVYLCFRGVSVHPPRRFSYSKKRISVCSM